MTNRARIQIWSLTLFYLKKIIVSVIRNCYIVTTTVIIYHKQ